MYTCVTCGLQFEDSNGQKNHMRSEWHRYNLKRRVAQLPSIDEDTFVSKIAAWTINNNSNTDTSAPGQKKKRELRRETKAALEARKRELFAARDALKGKSSYQKEQIGESLPKETQPERKEDKYDSSRSERNEESLITEKLVNKVNIPVTTCLFCPIKANMNFNTPEENVSHMFKHHGLYIPERKYIVDLAGLLTYLGEKIGLGNCCLCCSYQGKSLEAVRGHMLKKRHMRIPYENELEKLEISDFYDFTSTYQMQVTSQDDEWEDVSENEENDADEDEKYISTQESGHYFQSETSLHIASGAVIGHRLLAKYYRQYVKPERILTEGQGTVTAAETRHFIKAKETSLSQSKRVWLQVKKAEDQNDRHAAKFINNQPHFRDPLLQ